MQLRLHANATTTPRTRAYVQNSTASPAALARELGIHPRTVARWKTRPDVADRSTCPHRLATAISQWEEALIVELRRGLARALAIEGVAVERAGDKIAAADLFLRAGRSAAAQGDKTQRP
jgi:hypothetical protein